MLFLLSSFFFLGLYVFVFLIFVLSSCLFSFSCVSFSDSHLLCLLFVSFIFWRVSRLIVFVVVVLVLIPPLYHLLLFSPPPPTRALEKETNGKNTYLILFAFSGIFAKMSLLQNHLCFFWWISFVRRTNLFDVLGICFEGVRDYLLLRICCLFVVLVFGKEPSFGSTCLLCPFFGFVVFSVRALLILCVCVSVFLFVCLFFMGSGLFFSFSILFVIWDCLFFIALS